MAPGCRGAGGVHLINQGVIVSMGQIIVVLHTDDFANAPRFDDLRRRDVAEPDMTDKSLPL